MLVAVDADVLSLIPNPLIDPPVDPATGTAVSKCSERLEYLVAELEKARTRVIIPSPALSEFLVIADENGPDYLSEIDQHAIFSIEPFDAVAAVEAAAKTRAAIAKGNKKSGAGGTWQAVKTDRQIVPIAKTRGAVRIYSNDSDMRNIAIESGIEFVAVWELPLPPQEQAQLDFNEDS